MKTIFYTLVSIILLFGISCNNSTDRDHYAAIIELHDMYFLVEYSTILTSNWTKTQKSDTRNKQMLRRLHTSFFPELKQNINTIRGIAAEDKKALNETLDDIDELFMEQKLIMEQLNNPNAYNDIRLIIEINDKVQENGVIIDKSDKILRKISRIIQKMEQKAQIETMGTKIIFWNKLHS